MSTQPKPTQLTSEVLKLRDASRALQDKVNEARSELCEHEFHLATLESNGTVRCSFCGKELAQIPRTQSRPVRRNEVIDRRVYDYAGVPQPSPTRTGRGDNLDRDERAESCKPDPEPNINTRAGLLAEAARVVEKDRSATHGQPEQSFARVAALWSAYLGVPVAAHDVASMMAALKLARIRTNPGHADNWVDLAGYAACGAEVSHRSD